MLRVDLDWLFRKALVDRNLQSQVVYFRILQVKCQECVEVEVWALIKKQLHDACGLFVLIIQDGPVLKDVVLILMDEYWAKWQVPLYRLDPAFSRSWFIWSRGIISGWSSLVTIPTESPLLSFQLILFELLSPQEVSEAGRKNREIHPCSWRFLTSHDEVKNKATTKHHELEFHKFSEWDFFLKTDQSCYNLNFVAIIFPRNVAVFKTGDFEIFKAFWDAAHLLPGRFVHLPIYIANEYSWSIWYHPKMFPFSSESMLMWRLASRSISCTSMTRSCISAEWSKDPSGEPIAAKRRETQLMCYEVQHLLIDVLFLICYVLGSHIKACYSKQCLCYSLFLVM